jgi:hypothetical protein
LSIIDTKYDSLSSDLKAELGAPDAAGDVALADGGLLRNYERGRILWNPATGNAYEVHGQIYRRYAADGGIETSGYGYPTSDEVDAIRGRVSHFERADIFWDRADAYVVFPPPTPCGADPSTHGRWEIPAYTSGVIGVHAALLPTNQVLFFSFRPLDNPNAEPEPPLHGVSSVLDLATGSLLHPSYEGPLTDLENVFCAGHAFLADGRLLVVGGDREGYVRETPVQSIYEFLPGGPGGGHWHYLGLMRKPRFYPSAVTLPDGRVLIAGGMSKHDKAPAENNNIYEIYDRGTGLTPETGVIDIVQGDAANFPFLMVLPSHKVMVHLGTNTQLINLDTNAIEPAVLPAADRPDRFSRTYGVEGACVMLPLRPSATPPYQAKVMLIGGGNGGNIGTPATASCEILDTSAGAPAWRLTSAMHNPRVMPDAVLLPDGTVLAVNGSARGQSDNAASPVFEAEVFDPKGETWERLCNATVPRLYHATAILLPDARVMTAGTDGSWNPPPYNVGELRVEVFSPPYLFKGPRPVITQAPDAMDYKRKYRVQTLEPGHISEAVLVRCGSVTHSVNFDQRLIELNRVVRIEPPNPFKSPGQVFDDFSKKTPKKELAAKPAVIVESPPDGYVAPPGYYLLFLLKGGVPSVGHFVQLAASGHGFEPFRPLTPLRVNDALERLQPFVPSLAVPEHWSVWPPPPPPPPLGPELDLNKPYHPPDLIPRGTKLPPD